jgi:amyloid beta precursor protein binding protein 1
MATDKYDRQLRLWGHHGQKLLRECNICLLGSAAPGVEALKSLILPGAGHVVIWDDKITTVADLGTYDNEHRHKFLLNLALNW